MAKNVLFRTSALAILMVLAMTPQVDRSDRTRRLD